MPFSLALSGGGCRGAAHIGVLMALYEADLIPESISGASAGAIVAGLFGCGKTPEQLYSICKALQKGGSRLIDTDIAGMAYSALLLAMGKNIAISGIMQGKRLYRLLQRLTNDCMLTDLQLPLCIAAVDLMSGETIAFSQKKPL
ncbi:MAG: patatin-like phospholipase family protein, partial [Oscillospiraceae bacterium]|nr:patatin-like phospholipase family protein [Oscillospiraceae bacterium]